MDARPPVCGRRGHRRGGKRAPSRPSGPGRWERWAAGRVAGRRARHDGVPRPCPLHGRGAWPCRWGGGGGALPFRLAATARQRGVHATNRSRGGGRAASGLVTPARRPSPSRPLRHRTHPAGRPWANMDLAWGGARGQGWGGVGWGGGGGGGGGRERGCKHGGREEGDEELSQRGCKGGCPSRKGREEASSSKPRRRRGPGGTRPPLSPPSWPRVRKIQTHSVPGVAWGKWSAQRPDVPRSDPPLSLSTWPLQPLRVGSVPRSPGCLPRPPPANGRPCGRPIRDTGRRAPPRPSSWDWAGSRTLRARAQPASTVGRLAHHPPRPREAPPLRAVVAGRDGSHFCKGGGGHGRGGVRDGGRGEGGAASPLSVAPMSPPARRRG